MANNQLKEELILSTQHFDQKIDDVIKKVNKLQQQGNKAGNSFNSSMGGMLKKANGFGGSLTNILGVASKLSGVLGGITAGINLADWFSNSVKEGVRLAEAGEGIRLAFERLNRGDLLAKLREETHNTVTDIELMKQAVKFNDFNLDIEQMGKMLAYAQLKAKDTGESIDYMVNSITTGLGRKSLPILDNLGLSAAEIKEEMAKGGDMVTAVTKIIEKRMKEAGGYVDTAADRAERRRVELQNSLEELGRSFQPLSEASATLWHSIEVGAIQALNSLAPLINKLTAAGRLLNALNEKGSHSKVDRMIGMLGDLSTPGQKKIYGAHLARYDARIDSDKEYLSNFKKWQNGDKSVLDSMKAYEKLHGYSGMVRESIAEDVKEQLKVRQWERNEYERRAKLLGKSKKELSKPTPTPSGTTTTTRTTKDKVYAEGSLGYYESQISGLNEKLKGATNAKDYKAIQQQIGQYKAAMNDISADFMGSIFGDKANFAGSAIEQGLKGMQDVADKNPIHVDVKTDLPKVKASMEDITSVVAELGSSISGLGQALDAPVLDVAGVMAQAIATMIQAYATAQDIAAKTTGPWGWLAFGAIGLAQLTAIISTVKSLGAFANGGIVGGSSYSGDRLLARVNSGEMILSSSQQSHLFNMINNGGGGVASTGEVQFVIKGSDLYGTLKNYNSKMEKVR